MIITSLHGKKALMILVIVDRLWQLSTEYLKRCSRRFEVVQNRKKILKKWVRTKKMKEGWVYSYIPLNRMRHLCVTPLFCLNAVGLQRMENLPLVSHIKDLYWNGNPQKGYPLHGSDSITLFRVDFTILELDFQSKIKWSLTGSKDFNIVDWEGGNQDLKQSLYIGI